MARKEDELKTRLAAVLRDLQTEAKDDPEALFLIGSLASTLVSKAEKRSWREFKDDLSTLEYDMLLRDFQNQGKSMYAKGEGKKAYAVQTLGISLVCRTQRNDFQMREGEDILDSMISKALAAFRQAQRMQN